MLRVLAVMLCMVLVVGCTTETTGDEPVGVGVVADTAEVGDGVHTIGRVSLLGDLFCPCFHLTSDGGTVVVWYDLMTDDRGEFAAVGIAGVENGDTVVVVGEYRSTDPGTGFPVIWAEQVTLRR